MVSLRVASGQGEVKDQEIEILVPRQKAEHTEDTSV